VSPVVAIGYIGVGLLADPLTAVDLITASNIWPGVFPYATPLERILADQATGRRLGLTIPRRWLP